jgi:amino acid transporter
MVNNRQQKIMKRFFKKLLEIPVWGIIVIYVLGILLAFGSFELSEVTNISLFHTVAVVICFGLIAYVFLRLTYSFIQSCRAPETNSPSQFDYSPLVDYSPFAPDFFPNLCL